MPGDKSLHADLAIQTGLRLFQATQSGFTYIHIGSVPVGGARVFSKMITPFLKVDTQVLTGIAISDMDKTALPLLFQERGGLVQGGYM